MNCTHWNTASDNRHRSTRCGYPDPDIQDDLALRVVLDIEETRQRRGIAVEDVILCGVDNSSTAFAMAVLRLCPSDQRYSFCSGRRGTHSHECGCGEVDCRDCAGTLDDWCFRHQREYGGGSQMWVIVDDDICSGRSLRTVALRHSNVFWYGINNCLADYMDASCLWAESVTFTWWGTDQVCMVGRPAEPDKQVKHGDDFIHEWVATNGGWEEETSDAE